MRAHRANLFLFTVVLAASTLLLQAQMAHAQTALTLTASPNVVIVPTGGSGNTTITWTLPAGVTGQLWTTVPGSAPTAITCKGGPQTITTPINSITAAGATFDVYETKTCVTSEVTPGITLPVASVSVLTSNPITTSVNPVVIPQGQEGGDTEVYWIPPAGAIGQLWATAPGFPARAVGCASQTTDTPVNWITQGMTKFDLYVTNTCDDPVVGKQPYDEITVLGIKAAPNGVSIQSSSPNYSDIRSATWFEYDTTTTLPVPYAQSLTDLDKQIPTIKAGGFNAVWLITPWEEMEPTALPTPSWNDANFSALEQTLALLRANNMQAIINLDYLWTNEEPQGINAGSWTQDSAMYQAFVNYVQGFLQRIDGYQDVAIIQVATEGAQPSNLNSFGESAQIAAILQPTLGNLPNELPPSVRAKWRIGFHDYDDASLGQTTVQSPIMDPISFDFVSMTGYDGADPSDSTLETDLATRAAWFKALYPTTPLMMNEYGAPACSSSAEADQARVDLDSLNFAIANNMGSNLWQWNPETQNGFVSDCAAHLSGSGYNIINIDGTPRPAATDLAGVLAGSISSPTVPAPDQGAAPAPNDMVESTSNLNVRASASITGAKLGIVSGYSLGTILIAPSTGSWWDIKWNNGLSGWSSNAYLQVVSANTPPIVPPTSTTPQISSISPSSGPTGTVITITGINLTDQPANASKVYSGGLLCGSSLYSLAVQTAVDTLFVATVSPGTPSGKCSVQLSSGSSKVTAPFTVTAAPTPVPTATIQGDKVMMPGNMAANATVAAQPVSVIGGTSSTANPYFLGVNAGQTYTVSVPALAGYSIGYTLCIDNTSCHAQTPTPGNTASVSIPAGGGHYADLWWHYTPVSSNTASLTGSNSAVTTVPSVPLSPTASLTASPTSVRAGQSVTLTWNSMYATSCTGTGGGFKTDSAVSGSATTTPVRTTTYSVTCSGAGGSALASTTVTVVGKKTAISASDPQVASILAAIRSILQELSSYLSG